MNRVSSGEKKVLLLSSQEIEAFKQSQIKKYEVRKAKDLRQFRRVKSASSYFQEAMSPRQELVLKYINMQAFIQRPFWVIKENSPNFCEYLWQYFHNIDFVKIVFGNLSISVFDEFTLYPIDTLLIFANSFGIPDYSSIWKQLQSILTETDFANIRQYIKQHYLGEMPLFTSFVLPVENPKFKRIIYTALSDDTLKFPYSALWSAFCAIDKHNEANENENDKIKCFVSKGVWIDNDLESARQMFLAYCNWVSPPLELSAHEEEMKDMAMKKQDQVPNEAIDLWFIDRLMGGFVEQRGFIDENYLEKLAVWMESDKQDPKLRLACAKAIQHYILPEEFRTGYADFILQRDSAFQYLLDQILKGEIKAHREIDISQIVPEKILATTNCKVWVGKYNDQLIAIKEFNEDHISFDIQEIKREVAVMSVMRHEYLVPFIGASIKPGSFALATKYISGGNLRYYLKELKEPLPIRLQLKLASEIAQAIGYMHSRKMIHRDLKSLNILIDDGPTARVCDFGTAKYLYPEKTLTSNVGTVTWMAPEIFNGETYSEKADIYSYGLILWELSSRQVPFADKETFQIPILVTKGERPPFLKDTPSELQKLIKNLWQHQPKKRPGFDQILSELEILYRKLVIRTE